MSYKPKLARTLSRRSENASQQSDKGFLVDLLDRWFKLFITIDFQPRRTSEKCLAMRVLTEQPLSIFLRSEPFAYAWPFFPFFLIYTYRIYF